MFSKLFGQRASAQQDNVTQIPVGDTRPLAGNIYAFHTAPTNEFAVPETGRYAAIKILRANQKLVVIAVLEGIWSALPSLKEASRASILSEHRFEYTGRQAVFGVNVDSWSSSELNELTLLGSRPVSSQEVALATQIMNFAIGSRISTMRAASHAAEGEWRWIHDREAFSEEVERKKLQAEQERVAREERYRTRLSKLTWDQLLAETPFQRWSPSPPFPPEDFVIEARKVIHEACIALEALGPEPRKADVRAVLKRCVQWFNDADERAGGVIETEEREDICAVLEELAYMARQKGLVEEIDSWRAW